MQNCVDIFADLLLINMMLASVINIFFSGKGAKLAMQGGFP
jgi:hypothetical protein